MKILHLMRHGKSSWESPGISDIDRPLLPKGIYNTTVIAEKLALEKPQKILTSPANRALHTAMVVARTLRIPNNKICIINSLYETDTSTVIDEIENTENNIDILLVVGHNPTFTQLANNLLQEYIENIPTSGVVTLKFDSKDWEIIHKVPIASNVEFPKKDYF